MKNLSVLSVLFSLLILLSCGEDDMQPTTGIGSKNCKNVENPNPPENTDLISSSKMFGGENEFYSFYRLEDAGDDHLYYYGVFNDNSNIITVVVGEGGNIESSTTDEDLLKYGIGKMTKEGAVVWSDSPGFYVKSLLTIKGSQSSVFENFLVAVGSTAEHGVIKIYTPTGEEIVNHKVDDSWFNDVEIVNENNNGTLNFIAVGGLDNEPFVYNFDLLKVDSTLNFFHPISFPEAEGSWFLTAEKGDNDLFGLVLETSDSDAIEFCTINSDLEISTIKEIVNTETSFITWAGQGLKFNNGSFFYLCSVRDQDKGMTSDNRFWYSGLLLKFNGEGEQIWERKLSLTENSDQLNDIHFWEDNIYVSGFEGHVCKETECCFGNSTILKVSPSTGNIEKTFSFNISNNLESYNQMKKIGNSVIAVGYTNWHLNEEGKWPFQGLFTVLPFDDIK